MPLIVSYHVQDARWKSRLKPYCKFTREVLETAYAHAVPASQRKHEHAVALVLADNAFVKDLNHRYRGKNKPTNVLSFPNIDEPLGDLILAYETVDAEAAEQGKSFRHHTAHLLVHGLLHLLGHDHEVESEAERMEAIEVKILKKLGITDPYAA